MKDKDRLLKAVRKLTEHLKVCKVCANSILMVDAPSCSIAHQLNQAVKEINKGMKK